MNRSETIGELAKALAAAQGEFAPVEKKADNPFFRSKYADLPTVVMAASPILSKHGLSVSQWPEISLEQGADLLTTILMHTSGEWIEASMPLFLAKQDPQGQGSAITYARRYAYSAVVGIVTDVDDDGNAASNSPSAGKTTRRAAPKRPVPDGAPTADTPTIWNQKDAADASTEDIDHMPARAVSAALRAAKLDDGGSLPQMRARLKAHLSGGVSPSADSPLLANAAAEMEGMGEGIQQTPSAGNKASDKAIGYMNSFFDSTAYTREERLDAIGDIIERELETTTTMTAAEVSKVIEVMKPDE